MFHVQTFDGQHDLGLEFAAIKVAGIAQGVLDRLLRGHPDLLEEFPHGHVEIADVITHFALPLSKLLTHWAQGFYPCSMHRFAFIVCCAVALMAAAPRMAKAQDITLAVPQALQDSGLLEYVLPRFSLKTGVRIAVVETAETADLSLSADSGVGRAVFTGPQAIWHIGIPDSENENARQLVDWLTSEIGKRTVAAYTVDGVSPFGPPAQIKVEVAEITFDGDATRGKILSDKLCGRCHVVSRDERMNDIGSTPSFHVLRARQDWDSRFQSFYARNPHPAFTQVADVTPPFHKERPSPIVPVEMTLDDLESIMAYVAALKPADLGAPLQHQ